MLLFDLWQYILFYFLKISFYWSFDFMHIHNVFWSYSPRFPTAILLKIPPTCPPHTSCSPWLELAETSQCCLPTDLVGLTLCRSCVGKHSYCDVHEWNSHVITRAQYFTVFLSILPFSQPVCPLVIHEWRVSSFTPSFGRSTPDSASLDLPFLFCICVADSVFHYCR